MDLYLVSSYRLNVEITTFKGEQVYTGAIDRCTTDQMDMVVKEIEVLEANTLTITVI